MADNSKIELDQLWYTWSQYGLGGMQMDFRVRAASAGFHDLGMRYRRVTRFLNYELPEGTLPSEFTPAIAPITLAFVDNGDERLLIRKVFTDPDAFNRNGVFFTHLIAGLPPEFTAREAIELWYCPELWVESDKDKSPNDTYLEKIPYSRICEYLKSSQTNFSFNPISEPLQNLLGLILHRQRLPERIHVRGHTTLIAALIYGLTHTLPRDLLPNLTFTTYESQELKGETTVILGTLSRSELQDMAKIHIQPGQTTGPVPPDLLHYVSTAVNALVTNETLKLYNLIDELDRRADESGHHIPVTVNDLIELYKRRYRLTPLTLNQMEAIFRHPADNLQDLLDSTFQIEAAQLLLSRPDYWESYGTQLFQTLVSWLTPGAQTRLNQQTREALRQCIKGMAEYIFMALQRAVMAVNIPQQESVLVGVLAHPSTNPEFYDRMLTDFAQGQIYTQIISDPLWSFQVWLLECAKLMQPLPTNDQMRPWLHISSWRKLDQILRLDLPPNWEWLAMFELLKQNREIPKKAKAVVKAHEAKFIAFMQDLLRRGSQTGGNQGYISMALHLFAALMQLDKQAIENNEPDYIYPDRVNLLIPLLNAVPNNSLTIESLIAIFPSSSPYQLTMDEFDLLVMGCSVDLLAAGGASPSFMKYLQEYILMLTPRRLNQKTYDLLSQFQRASTALPKDTADLVQSWLDISTFLEKRSFDDEALQYFRLALTKLVPLLKARNLDIWKEFVVELVPHLLNLIEEEYQLRTVLSVFEGARIVLSWDLLNVLAIQAQVRYADNPPMLFPYVLAGIRECARSGKSKEDLDAYFQSLLDGIGKTVLGEIDKAISAKVWLEGIQNEWTGWRDRTKSTWVSNIPGVNKIIAPQQQRSQTGSQPGQAQNPDSVDPVIVIIKAYDQKVPLKDSYYKHTHLAYTQVLPYWIQVLDERLAQGRTKSIALEKGSISSLLTELKSLPVPVTTISEKLIQYLSEDMLILLEIKRLDQRGEQNIVNFLNSERSIVTRLNDFQKFVGQGNYVALCQSIPENLIKDALHTLIRRYYFIQHIDSIQKDWGNWLVRERRNTKIEYPKLARK